MLTLVVVFKWPLLELEGTRDPAGTDVGNPGVAVGAAVDVAAMQEQALDILEGGYVLAIYFGNDAADFSACS